MNESILKTLCYSDIFDFPLTVRELWTYFPTKIRLKKFLSYLPAIPHASSHGKMYYFLLGRESLVRTREKRMQISLIKMKKAKQISRVLSLIPTIAFIGVSGSLAMSNAEKKSDIDLFFITYPYTVWITRFLVYVILGLIGQRRKKNLSSQSDSICANMFFDKDHMRLPLKKRTLYGAHEVMQILPLFDREKIHAAFLCANSWVTTYFPNVLLPKRVRTVHRSPLWILFVPFEFFARITQMWYMKKSKTREVLTPFLIAFHPIDYEAIIMDAYEKKKKTYGI